MAKKSIVKPKQREAEPEKKKAERVGFVEQMKNLLNSRWTYVFCSAILMFVFYVNYNEVYDKKPDLNGDNIIYYSLGKSLAEGNGYTDVISYNKMPHTHFPPGYPAFIATCLSLDSELDFEHFKKLNGVLLGLSVLMFFLILKRVTNNNLFVAFSASVLMCLQRELLRFSTIVMSEMLYLFLTMLVVYLAVVLYQKRSFKDYTWRSYVALVMFLLVISYIYFVRTMGLSMILGVIGWFGALAFCSFVKFYRDKRSGEESVLYKSKALYCLKMMALASLALFLAKGAWDIRNEKIGHTQSNYVSNFKKKERGEVMSSMSDWVARCKSNVKNYVGKLIPESVFVVDYEDNYVVTKTDFVLGVVLLALILIGLFFIPCPTKKEALVFVVDIWSFAALSGTVCNNALHSGGCAVCYIPLFERHLQRFEVFGGEGFSSSVDKKQVCCSLFCVAYVVRIVLAGAVAHGGAGGRSLLCEAAFGGRFG